MYASSTVDSKNTLTTSTANGKKNMHVFNPMTHKSSTVDSKNTLTTSTANGKKNHACFQSYDPQMPATSTVYMAKVNKKH